MNFISNIFGGGSKKVIDGDDNKNKKENLFSAENKEKINKLLITLEGIDKDKIKKVLLNKNTHDGLRAISPTSKSETFGSLPDTEDLFSCIMFAMWPQKLSI